MVFTWFYRTPAGLTCRWREEWVFLSSMGMWFGWRGMDAGWFESSRESIRRGRPANAANAGDAEEKDYREGERWGGSLPAADAVSGRAEGKAGRQTDPAPAPALPASWPILTMRIWFISASA
ncbi:Uncharacterized protein ChrSV_3693 [Chromobacterium vaccinii]|nr:Uncharacterized protein ChrSW_3693 [Chromobacterium vaccinii]QND91150.1 Uncharacterized protein ChrSV_3693 [Chromobacterium vaccinii]